MAYTMTRKEVMNFASEHQLAMMLMMQAANDYPAGRCCLINGLFSGSILASQAIEKILKAYLNLHGKTYDEIKSLNHNFEKIVQDISSYKDYGLHEYDYIFTKLADSFKHKYPGIRNRPSRLLQLNELNIVDKLWVHLIENLPMPDEVKYSSPIYASICANNGVSIHFYDGFWMLNGNNPLQSILVEMLKKYNEVKNHLYPNRKEPEKTSNLPVFDFKTFIPPAGTP